MANVQSRVHRVKTAKVAVRGSLLKKAGASITKPPTSKPVRSKLIRGKSASTVASNKLAARVTLKLPAKVSPDALWKRYAALRTQPERATERVALRNQLVVMYHHLVRYTAERMRTRLPSEVEVDDLISAGLFGLFDAINAFDPSRGIKFETYCPQRVRGAIFDELRQLDWVPRLVRSRTSRMDRVRKQIEMSQGRPATNEELQATLDVSADEFEKINRDSRPVGIVSLNKKWTDGDSSGEAREIDVPNEKSETDAFEMLQSQDLQMLLTRGLTRSERLIVILYYYEELTMKEIGITLDLSESRVSQMHSSILARLKSQMKHRLKELSED